MLVEVPAGGEQQVTAAHRDGVALDVGPHALALQDEPECGLRVPMRVRDLVRAQVLDRRPQGGGGVGLARDTGVRERDRAALAASADRDELAGPFGQRVQRAPAPSGRLGGRPRRQRHQVVALRPQRHHARGREPLVQLAELFVGVCLVVGFDAIFQFSHALPPWFLPR
jgi:hypothetical protein